MGMRVTFGRPFFWMDFWMHIQCWFCSHSFGVWFLSDSTLLLLWKFWNLKIQHLTFWKKIQSATFTELQWLLFDSQSHVFLYLRQKARIKRESPPNIALVEHTSVGIWWKLKIISPQGQKNIFDASRGAFNLIWYVHALQLMLLTTAYEVISHETLELSAPRNIIKTNLLELSKIN